MSESTQRWAPIHRVIRPSIFETRTVWTMIGAIAIPLWATWPLLATLGHTVPSTASQLPPFEQLAIAFAAGTLLLLGCTRGSDSPRRHARGRTHWFAVTMAVLGLLGSNACYVFSMRMIPPAQANLIAYLWPLMIVTFGGILGLMPLAWRHGVGVVTGLAGTALVIGADQLTLSWHGIGLALAAGFAWAASCLFRIYEGEKAGNIFTQGYAVSALLSAALHLLLERTITPSVSSFVLAILVGLLPLGLGTVVWDHGLRRGDRKLLATMAYATPLISTVMLIAFGFAAPSLGLVSGGLLIVGAGFISANKS